MRGHYEQCTRWACTRPTVHTYGSRLTRRATIDKACRAHAVYGTAGGPLGSLPQQRPPWHAGPRLAGVNAGHAMHTSAPCSRHNHSVHIKGSKLTKGTPHRQSSSHGVQHVEVHRTTTARPLTAASSEHWAGRHLAACHCVYLTPAGAHL